MRVLVSSGLLFFSSMSVAAADHSAGHGLVSFAVLDSDRNGYVSRVEARSVRPVEGRFDLADINRDGLLDRKEYRELRAASDKH